MSLLQEYKAHEAQRQNEGGLPGLALTAAQTADFCPAFFLQCCRCVWVCR